MKIKTKEYVVTQPNVRIADPKTGETVSRDIGVHIQLTDEKAKALVNKVKLVVKPIVQTDPAPKTGDDDKAPDGDAPPQNKGK